MKKILIALVTFAAAALAAGSLYAVAGDLVSNFRNDDRRVEGSGRIVTRTFDVGAFQGLKAFSCARVTLVKGSGPATVKIDDNLLPYLCLKVEKGTLRIGLKSEKGHFNNFRNVTLEVTVPCDGQIGELDASGASHIDAEELRTEVCTAGASGASAIAVSCTRTLNATASGASSVRYKSPAGSDLSIHASSSGAGSIKRL